MTKARAPEMREVADRTPDETIAAILRVRRGQRQGKKQREVQGSGGRDGEKTDLQQFPCSTSMHMAPKSVQ